MKLECVHDRNGPAKIGPQAVDGIPIGVGELVDEFFDVSSLMMEMMKESIPEVGNEV